MSLAYLEIDQARSEYTTLPAEVRREFDARLIQSWLYHDHMLEGVVLTPGISPVRWKGARAEIIATAWSKNRCGA